MKRKITTTIIFTFLAVMVSSAMAQGMRMHGKMGRAPLLKAPWDRVSFILNDIGLNDEQIEHIKQIRKDYRHSSAPIRMELSERVADLQEIMANADLSNEDEIVDMVEKISSLKLKMMKMTIHARLEIASLLSEEQKNLLKEKMNRFKQNKRFGRKKFHREMNRISE